MEALNDWPEAKSRETLRSKGNRTHFLLWSQSLSVLLYLLYLITVKKLFALIMPVGS